MNALDGRTYKLNGISSEERLSCIYARGKSIDLLNWIDQRYKLREPSTERFDGPEQTERCSWMMMEYFLHQTTAIRSYKREAVKSGIWGSESARNCTLELLSKELDMVVKIFPGSNKKHRHPSMASTSLAWNGINYYVECKRQSYSTSKFLLFSLNTSNSQHIECEKSFEYYNDLGSTEGDRAFLAHIAPPADAGRFFRFFL